MNSRQTEDGRSPTGRATLASHQAPAGLGHSEGIPNAGGFQACNTYDLFKAICEFRGELPGWWFTVGECSVSADASCGPDRAGPDADLLKDRTFDDGFHADLPQPASMADALRRVTAIAIETRSATTRSRRGPQG